jgi:hypothetical protein
MYILCMYCRKLTARYVHNLCNYIFGLLRMSVHDKVGYIWVFSSLHADRISPNLGKLSYVSIPIEIVEIHRNSRNPTYFV